MKIIDIVRDKRFFNILLNRCLLIFYSDEGVIREANSLAIKTLRFNPENYVGSSFYIHCKTKRFALINFLEKEDTPAHFKETYGLTKNNTITVVWEKVNLPMDHNKKYFLLVVRILLKNKI